MDGEQVFYADQVKGSATLQLPGAEGERHRDMVFAGMLTASNNYIGNQVSQF